MPDWEQKNLKFRFEERYERILKIISRNGVCLILFYLHEHPMKFSDLMFTTKLNPGVVDRHLKSLMKLNIIERKDSEYRLTEKGTKLVSVIEELFNVIED